VTEPRPPSESDDFSRIQILIAMGVTAVALLIVARVWMAFGSVQVLPIYLTGLAIAQGVGLGIGITLTSSLVYWLWAGYRHSAEQYLQLVLKPLVWPDLIWLGLLPGLSEELLFRGVMLPALGLNGVALMLSSCFFGILHFNGTQNWSYVIWAAAVGLILGSAALVTGNLLVPIVAHILTNLISSCVWKFISGRPNLTDKI
jgi:membrane protease YdiL (CAAX protease family)